MFVYPAITVEDAGNPGDSSITALPAMRSGAFSVAPPPPRHLPVPASAPVLAPRIVTTMAPTVGTPVPVPYTPVNVAPKFNPGSVNSGGVSINTVQEDSAPVTDVRQTPTAIVTADGSRVPAPTQPIVQAPAGTTAPVAPTLTHSEIVALVVLGALLLVG